MSLHKNFIWLLPYTNCYTHDPGLKITRSDRPKDVRWTEFDRVNEKGQL